MKRYLSRGIGMLALLLSVSLAACEQTSITGVDALEPAAAAWSKGNTGNGAGKGPIQTAPESGETGGVQSDYGLAFP